REGRVRWISKPSCNIFHDPKQFLDIIAVKKQRPSTYDHELSSLHFWKVWECRETVLIGAVGTPQVPEAQNLTAVHRNLTNNFFRLLELERDLAERARRRRGRTGRNAVRQIELERQRLGRQLHTGVGQMLAAIR